MDIKTYSKEVQRTVSELPLPEHNIHMLMGMTTEVGELVDVFKKNLAYGKDIDWINVEEEIGDLLWYIANFCSKNGIDLEQTLQKNVDKLVTRYPDKFDADKAINRDTTAERKTLVATGRIKEMSWD